MQRDASFGTADNTVFVGMATVHETPLLLLLLLLLSSYEYLLDIVFGYKRNIMTTYLSLLSVRTEHEDCQLYTIVNCCLCRTQEAEGPQQRLSH